MPTSKRGKNPKWQSPDHPNLSPGSGIIFVIMTGDYSTYLEQLDRNTMQVQQEVMEVLRRMYPNASDLIDILMPF
ncbi:hypothetical protein EDC04DRAFT_2030099 [Pisolithus marmoratus]|nr:hypothetical protein EDC04DRAFT_2030099 [Pisolithus marmoratus]